MKVATWTNSDDIKIEIQDEPEGLFTIKEHNRNLNKDLKVLQKQL